MRTSAKYPLAICLGWILLLAAPDGLAQVASPLAIVDMPKPAYPTKEIKAGHKGRVMIKVAVDANGTVTSATVHSSSGWRKLDDSALAAVRAGTFQAARNAEGTAVASQAIVPITFGF